MNAGTKNIPSTKARVGLTTDWRKYEMKAFKIKARQTNGDEPKQTFSKDWGDLL